MVKKYIEDSIISDINYNEIIKFEQVIIKNCHITNLDMEGAFELNTQLIIENCIIDFFKIHSCWFSEGLSLKNNIFKNYIDYQMGGHNKKPIIIEENIFNNFFNFFDCQFSEKVELKKNIFIHGSNLMGNLNEGFKNVFDEIPLLENNIGSIYLDGFGD